MEASCKLLLTVVGMAGLLAVPSFGDARAGRGGGAHQHQSRLRALKIGLLIMAGIALVAIFPASRLPDYRAGEIPHDPFETPETARDSAMSVEGATDATA